MGGCPLWSKARLTALEIFNANYFRLRTLDKTKLYEERRAQEKSNSSGRLRKLSDSYYYEAPACDQNILATLLHFDPVNALIAKPVQACYDNARDLIPSASSWYTTCYCLQAFFSSSQFMRVCEQQIKKQHTI